MSSISSSVVPLYLSPARPPWLYIYITTPRSPTMRSMTMPISSDPPARCLLLQPEEASGGGGRRLTRLLVNVTVDRSLWPVHVVLAADATVADLVRAAVAAYEREGRRPPLQGQGQAAFELHFSKYALQSLRPEEKVLDLGSRNFFLCARRPAAASADAAYP